MNTWQSKKNCSLQKRCPLRCQGAVPKVMSVALIEPFDRWFLRLSKGSGITRRNDCYTKFGGFDKLNHRNANLLDSPLSFGAKRQKPMGEGRQAAAAMNEYLAK